MTRLAVFLVFLAVLLLALILTDRADDPVNVRAESTSEPTPSTTWLETQPELGEGFDELLAGVARAKAAHRVKPKRRDLFVAAYATEVVTLIREGFARFGPDVAEQAVRVAACETGQTFDPGATNGSHRGLFQISTRWHAERVARLGFTLDQLWQARPNIAVAADLYSESGWGPWECRWAA